MSVRINGNTYDWGSITIKCNGEVYSRITAITYSHKRERSKEYGTGKHRAPRGRSRGKYTVENPTVTIAKSELERLRTDLAAVAPGGASYGDIEFDVVVQFVEADETPITDTIHDCVVAGEDSAHDEGSTDTLSETLTLDAMWIDRNGRTLFDNSDGEF